jgi:hypothetical protein
VFVRPEAPWASGLARTLCLNVCDAPTAQIGHVAQFDMACRKQTVEELKSPGVEELWGKFSRSDRMVTVCHFATLDSRLLDLNSTEQSENVYENKQSRSSGVEELWGQIKRPGRMVTVCHFATLDSRLLDLSSTEQSENVYENKESSS